MIFDNVESLQQAGNKNDIGQYIRFKYNSLDSELNIRKLKRVFSRISVIDTLPYNERFGIVDMDEFNMCRHSDNYRRLAGKNGCAVGFRCLSNKKKFVYIDNFGTVYPCFLYRFYNVDLKYAEQTYFGDTKHDFCFECESHALSLLNKLGIEPMV